MIIDNWLMLHINVLHVATYITFTLVDDETVGVPSSTTDGEDCSNLFVILAVMFLATSVIITTISIILAWKLWGQKKENGMCVTYSCSI